MQTVLDEKFYHEKSIPVLAISDAEYEVKRVGFFLFAHK